MNALKGTSTVSRCYDLFIGDWAYAGSGIVNKRTKIVVQCIKLAEVGFNKNLFNKRFIPAHNYFGNFGSNHIF